MRRIALWAFIAWLAWWAITDPASAAHLVHGLGGALSRAAASLSRIASGI